MIMYELEAMGERSWHFLVYCVWIFLEELSKAMKNFSPAGIRNILLVCQQFLFIYYL
jgi:hypothetical protein